MNHNSINATSWARGANLYIPITGIDYDQQAVNFVESVCAALNEDRFGPGRTANFVIARNHPELEPAVNYDLTDRAVFLHDEHSPTEGLTWPTGGVCLKTRQCELLHPSSAVPTRMAASSSVLSRGSPSPPGTRLLLWGGQRVRTTSSPRALGAAAKAGVEGSAGGQFAGHNSTYWKPHTPKPTIAILWDAFQCSVHSRRSRRRFPLRDAITQGRAFDRPT
ncbi:hypothetical protein BH10ACI3_BH10ACI3_06360 [soil metagenome]